MKKSFKYIFSFILMFIIFVPSYKAADDYMFYCDYDVIVIKGTSGKASQAEQSFPLRVQVYEDGSSKFYSGSKELVRMRTTTSDLGLGGSYKIDFNSKDFYKEATKSGKYTCPSITNDISNLTDVRLEYYEGVETADMIPARKKTSSPVVNSGLSNSEKDEINSNIDTVTRTCKIAYDASVKNIPLRFNITLTSYNSGKNTIKIGDSLEQTYVNNRDTVFNLGDYDLFFYAGEEHLLFDGSCPSSSEFFPDETATSTATHKMFFITMDRNTLDERGKGNVGEIVEPLPDGSLNGNFNLTIGNEIGVCVDYLGSASRSGTIASLLDSVYTIIKIGSILLVIVFSMLDFAKTVSHSKDDLMASVKKCAIRLVILIIILLLPTFIDMIGNLFGIEDVLCGIK